ncbi:hypothetical protein [Anabaena azotica]|uniref:Uncharacterized protein n=1 Tax=Anabaena azotica FACHB-119 TaxID=947527 RepID=A0ABR8DE15_9NOST|nr:hypothetical protein [Anabaena azotica]MBD2505480.1 hypothetical protein [Anabaena azotica FACHB-119]
MLNLDSAIVERSRNLITAQSYHSLEASYALASPFAPRPGGQDSKKPYLKALVIVD